MKRYIREKLVVMVSSLLFVFTVPTMTRGEVGISISLPPPIIFASPPVMIVIPETYVYVVPDQEVDIFFYDGWWSRPWEGYWYRSPYYYSGWAYYQSAPSFYAGIPLSWRSDYRDHLWGGYSWNYQRIPYEQLQQNWKSWKKNGHWEKQNTWGVQGLTRRSQTQRPARAVKPKAAAKPQMRELNDSQQGRRQPEKVKPLNSRPHIRKAPQKDEPAEPQRARPQSGKHLERSKIQ